ncbi:MAG: hypothetical protein AAF614_42730, partial [Chloroflexota bacterium]
CVSNSLEIIERLRDSHGVARVLLKRGDIYHKMSQPDHARSDWEKSLVFAKQLKMEALVTQLLLPIRLAR